MRKIDKNRHGILLLDSARLFCFVFPNFLCYISSQYPKRHLAGKWQKVLARVKNSLNFDKKFQFFFGNLAIFSPKTLGISDRNNFILAIAGNFSQKQGQMMSGISFLANFCHFKDKINS
jgi:hypothetical protein